MSENDEIKSYTKLVIQACYDVATDLDNEELGKDNVIPLDEPDHVCSISEMKSTGVYFPGRPVVRNLKTVDIGSNKEQTCTKIYQSNSRLGSGLVLFWCARHRVCLGWVLLRSAESLEIVYQTILTRFPVIPKVICYDNACNLQEYCNNRAPRYVK